MAHQKEILLWCNSPTIKGQDQELAALRDKRFSPTCLRNRCTACGLLKPFCTFQKFTDHRFRILALLLLFATALFLFGIASSRKHLLLPTLKAKNSTQNVSGMECLLYLHCKHSIQCVQAPLKLVDTFLLYFQIVFAIHIQSENI